MMISYLYDVQLQWIRKIQDILRSPDMDAFFLAWNRVDTTAFMILLIAIVWFLIDRKIGIKLYYILIISLTVNVFLKFFFGMPRPCQIDPSLGVVSSSSFGFPSGAAQTAILLSGILFIECKKTLYRVLGVIFASFLCFSRIYLGMHYPTDILGGLVVGGLLLIAYWKAFPQFEMHWKRWAFLLPLAFLILWQQAALKYALATLGLAMGLWIYDRLKMQPAKRWEIKVGQTMIVIIGLFACHKLMKVLPLFNLFYAFLSGIWLSFLASWVVIRFVSSRP